MINYSKRLCTFFLLSVVFISCNDKANKIKFNHDIVSIVTKANGQQDDLKLLMKIQGFETIDSDTKIVTDTLNSYLKEVEQIKVVGNGDSLKIYALEYLKLLITTVDSYKKLGSFSNNNITEEDLLIIKEHIDESEDNLNKSYTKLQDAQHKYVSNNELSN